MLNIYGKKLYCWLSLFFILLRIGSRLMVFIFIWAWGSRKQKINFLHLILSKTLSHWRCTFNILKFNIFFFLSTFFSIRLLYIVLLLKFGLKYLIYLLLIIKYYAWESIEDIKRLSGFKWKKISFLQGTLICFLTRS